MKVVLDTNVWISSLLLPHSIPGKIVAAWQQGIFTVVTSAFILEEIKSVLQYPKIKKRLSVTPNDIDKYIAFLRFFTEVIDVNPQAKLAKELRDTQDVSILATFICSQSDYLVTGDHDLLILNNQHPIITPQAFASLIE